MQKEIQNLETPRPEFSNENTNTAIITVNKNCHFVLNTGQESFPSPNEVIEEATVHPDALEEAPLIRMNKQVYRKMRKGKCRKDERLKNVNEEHNNGNNYEVVLVDNKDLVAEEFSSDLVEKANRLMNRKELKTLEDIMQESDSKTSGDFEMQRQDTDDDDDDGDISQRYLCYVCGKAYKQLSHLSRHTKVAHNEEPVNRCNICDTTFTRHESLIRHLKLHEQRNGVNATKGPYKCPKCPKTYQQLYNVSRHLITHYGEKPFQCSQCGKKFTQHTGLARHLVLHKGNKDFKCDVCGKSFARQFVLDRHKFTHTDDKPYKCFVCSKSFIRASQLGIHIQTHKTTGTD